MQVFTLAEHSAQLIALEAGYSERHDAFIEDTGMLLEGTQGRLFFSGCILYLGITCNRV
jgi:hypothetical protein